MIIKTNIAETGNATAEDSLGHKVDEMLSGPADKVCLALRRAASTVGIEMLALSEIGALQAGRILHVEPSIVNTGAKRVLRKFCVKSFSLVHFRL